MIKNERVIKLRTGCFIRKFHWDFSGLPEPFSGILVQHLTTKSSFTNFSPSDSDVTRYNRSYYEYWEVSESTIVPPLSISTNPSSDHDDCWSFNPSTWELRLQDCANKYMSSGIIKMTGKIHLLQRDTEAYEQIKNEFEINCKVKSSGDLPSMLESLFTYKASKGLLPPLNEYEPFFVHEFANSWDFTDDGSFVLAVKEVLGNNEYKINDDIKYFSELPIYQMLKAELENHYHIIIE